ncbi:MAG: hypothetical protein WBA97_01710 [Actinophytocola sp.]|uniref:NfeD family protein n=1 Tax=Actinophytocola sp. TaxID=1872138 RepID=UPI003C749667
MSHEGGPEQPQRTVAELLAKYGAESGERAPRRRRRRADDMDDTGAQAIIDRVLSESGEMRAIRDDMPPPERTSHRRGTSTGQYPRLQPPPQPQEPPLRRQPPQPSQQLPRPLPSHQPPQPSQQLPRPAPQHHPGPPPVGPPSSGRLPAISRPNEPTTPVRGTPRPIQGPPPDRQPPRPQPSQRMPLPPPPGGNRERTGGNRERSGIQPSLRSRLDGLTDSAPPPPPPMPSASQEPTTEELPRVSGRVPVDGSMTGRRPVVPGADSRTRISPVYPPPHDPYADVPDEKEDYRSSYPATGQNDRYDSAEYDNLIDEDDDRVRDFDSDLDDLEDDDLDDDRVRSPAKEWAIMGGQLALGVIGGAAIWLGFNWLWGFMPQAALVVALAVIVGLVLIVRKIRRAEDLQTTFLAVLVGLVVTVSPAALLLLNK